MIRAVSIRAVSRVVRGASLQRRGELCYNIFDKEIAPIVRCVAWLQLFVLYRSSTM